MLRKEASRENFRIPKARVTDGTGKRLGDVSNTVLMKEQGEGIKRVWKKLEDRRKNPQPEGEREKNGDDVFSALAGHGL